MDHRKAWLILALLLCSGCAVVRDPHDGVVYTGWGEVHYRRERPVPLGVVLGEQQWGTETVQLDRIISTKEVLLEFGGLVTAVAGAAVLLLPLL